MPGTAVRTALDGQLWRVTLDRPAAGNAIDLDLAGDLADAARSVPAGARTVLLQGSGARFCVGGDIRGFAEAPDLGAHVGVLARAWHAAVRALANCPVPVVVAAHGAVAGAGVGLLGVGDVTLCARSTVIRPAYAGLGFSPDGGTSWVLTRGLGPARASELMLTNGSLTADEAQQAGLVSRVVGDEELEQEAGALAGQLAAGPVRALLRTRRLVRAAIGTTLDEHLDLEAVSIAESADDDEGREGVRAFVERRRPVFAPS